MKNETAPEACEPDCGMLLVEVASLEACKPDCGTLLEEVMANIVCQARSNAKTVSS